MRTQTDAVGTKWSEDLSLVMIYAVVLTAVVCMAAMTSIPDAAVTQAVSR